MSDLHQWRVLPEEVVDQAPVELEPTAPDAGSTRLLVQLRWSIAETAMKRIARRSPFREGRCRYCDSLYATPHNQGCDYLSALVFVGVPEPEL